MSPQEILNVRGGGEGGRGTSTGMMSIRERIRAMQLEREHEDDDDRVGSSTGTRRSSLAVAAPIVGDGNTTRMTEKASAVPSWKKRAMEAAAARRLQSATSDAEERGPSQKRRPMVPSQSMLQKRREGRNDECGSVESRRLNGGGSDSPVKRWNNNNAGRTDGVSKLIGDPSGNGRRSGASRTAPPPLSSAESRLPPQRGATAAVVPPPSPPSPPSSSARDDDTGNNKQSPSFLTARRMFQAGAAGGTSPNTTTSTPTGTHTGMTSSSTALRRHVEKMRKRQVAGRLGDGDATGDDDLEGATGGVLEADGADDPTMIDGGNDGSRGAKVTKRKDLRAMDFAIDFYDGEEGQLSDVEGRDVLTTTTATMRPSDVDFDGKSSMRDGDRATDTARAHVEDGDDDDSSLGSTSTSAEGDYRYAPTSPIGARGLSSLMQAAETTPKITAAVVTPPPSAAPSSVSSSGCRSERSDTTPREVAEEGPKPHLAWLEGQRRKSNHHGDPLARQQQRRRLSPSPSAESAMLDEVDAGPTCTAQQPESSPRRLPDDAGGKNSVRGSGGDGFAARWEKEAAAFAPAGDLGAEATIVIADGSSVVRRTPRDTFDADWNVDCVSAPSDEEDASTGTVKMSNTQESSVGGSEQRQGSDGHGQRRQQGGEVDSEQGPGGEAASLPSSGIFSRGGPPRKTPRRQPPPPEVTPPGGQQHRRGHSHPNFFRAGGGKGTPFSNRYRAAGGGPYENLFNVMQDVAMSNLSMLERLASGSVLGAYVAPKWRCGENAAATATDVSGTASTGDVMTPTAAAASAAANDILLANMTSAAAPPGECIEESVAIEVEYMEDRPTSRD